MLTRRSARRNGRDDAELTELDVHHDAIDAIRQSRGGGVRLVTNDEREQTLNQLLAEIAGFKTDGDSGHQHARHEPARDPRPGAAAGGTVRSPDGPRQS